MSIACFMEMVGLVFPVSRVGDVGRPGERVTIKSCSVVELWNVVPFFGVPPLVVLWCVGS
eukprot:11206267-Lingulodinium_polyedra.AAC.1